ncbi:GNAT family N-acetyltransferase [Mesobacillus maritimus]|uniref:GNAT family N-acetyltransferase n=1 Tax=Mesobacillus maritimus TaxID=1643336 RepID=UPI00203ECC7E|nr:GNAT family N-acetyltransferase [Mesobacillus maritimus]MCM3668526.1 GNAT family N-acetyltransferase [Mesobacillus maritimus]
MLIDKYPTLETERLLLKLLTLEDVNEVFTHFSNPLVTRFMDIEPCKSIEEAEEVIQYHLKDEGCRWGIFKEDSQFIGTVGFHHLRAKKDETIAEIGFDLSNQYWGQGLMVEALTKVLSFGFSKMNLTKIDATVDPANERCIHLLNKLDFACGIELQEEHLLYYYLKNPSRR